MLAPELSKEWVDKAFPTRRVLAEIPVCETHKVAMCTRSTKRDIKLKEFKLAVLRYCYCEECKKDGRLNSRKVRVEIDFKSYFNPSVN